MPRIFNQLILKDRRSQLRNKMTIQERKLWKLLKHRQLLNIKFHRQYGIGPYIADFYAPEIKLCIECDGLQHQNETGKEYDEMRDNFMVSLGISVFRIKNIEIDDDLYAVIEKIEQEVNRLKRTPASLL